LPALRSFPRLRPVNLGYFRRGRQPDQRRLERVGAKLTLRAKGIYHITMVHQAPDDNHLRLTVK
jgi:hypothetical protein